MVLGEAQPHWPAGVLTCSQQLQIQGSLMPGCGPKPSLICVAAACPAPPLRVTHFSLATLACGRGL